MDKAPHFSRRDTLLLLGGLGASTLGSSRIMRAAGSAAPPPPANNCVLIPQETDGPYPLYSILSNAAIVRTDITEGKAGIPLALVINLQNVNRSCAALSQAAVYIWHCDIEGSYSGYRWQMGSEGRGGTTGESFLRGVQVSDSRGNVKFKTIYPGWYRGRYTHIHLQVYLNNKAGGDAVATSQIAFPGDINEAVYNSRLYAAHGQNGRMKSVTSDFIFSDGAPYQIPAITGDINNGFVATLNVGIAV